MEFMRRRHACVKKEGLTNRQKLEQEELNEYIAAILTLQDSIDATGNFHVHYREVMSEKQREAQRAAEMRSSDPRPKAEFFSATQCKRKASCRQYEGTKSDSQNGLQNAF